MNRFVEFSVFFVESSGGIKFYGHTGNKHVVLDYLPYCGEACEVYLKIKLMVVIKMRNKDSSNVKKYCSLIPGMFRSKSRFSVFIKKMLFCLCYKKY